MEEWNKKLGAVRQSLQNAGLDGWLLYDFRRTNELACKFLGIPLDSLLTRRFFYWLPAKGEPVKILNRMETHSLSHVSGLERVYSSYNELENLLKEILSGKSKIAMEYSPCNAIPVISKVDAGTVELVRGFGVEVVSSADILQQYTSVWTNEQLESHIYANEVLQNSVEKAWRMIGDAIAANQKIDEADVQQFLLSEFEKYQCVCDDPPICAVNTHSAEPHYSPKKNTATQIKRGDFVLIDVWCKKNVPHAVYADLTRVAVVAETPSIRQKKIFDVVKAGRDAAIDLIEARLQTNAPICGWEVDQVCRDAISKLGYGQYFTHRTGHNIGEKDHGEGANIDNFETKDLRRLLPGTCFSIEPGVYLPGEFGVRLEDDVYLNIDGRGMRVTKGLQTEIQCINV